MLQNAVDDCLALLRLKVNLCFCTDSDCGEPRNCGSDIQWL